MSPTSYLAALFRDLKVDGVEGFEPSNDGTKNRCLTAWRYPKNIMEGRGFEPLNPKERIYSPPRLATSLSLHHIKKWSETDSNRRHLELQSSALPTELSDQNKIVKTAPTGFEPAISCVTGRHVDPYTTEPMEVDGIEPPTSCL